MIFRRAFLALALLTWSQGAPASPLALQAQSSLYTPQASAYFNQITANGCTAPTANWKTAVAAYFKGLITTGVWQTINIRYVFMAADACTSEINLKNPGLFTITVNGSPPFAAYEGWTGTGNIADFLNTNWNQSTNGAGLFSLNSATVEEWTTNPIGGAILLGDVRTRVQPSVPNIGWRITSGNGDITVNPGTNAGMFMITRNGATSASLYANGANVITTATASTALYTSGPEFILCFANTTCNSPGINQVAMAGFGGAQTAQNAADDFALTQTLKNAVFQ